MLITPEIIGSSNDQICTTFGDSVSLYCLFNAIMVEGVTIVVWQRNHQKISGYETRPVQGEDNQLKSILQITSITQEDTGIYTCYCKYNEDMVKFEKPSQITSDRATMFLYAYMDDSCSAEGNTGQLEI